MWGCVCYLRAPVFVLSEKSCWSLKGERTAVNVTHGVIDTEKGRVRLGRLLYFGREAGAGKTPAWNWDPSQDKTLPTSPSLENCKTWILWECFQKVSCEDSLVLWSQFFFSYFKKTKLGFVAFWVKLVLICIPPTCLWLWEASKCV